MMVTVQHNSLAISCTATNVITAANSQSSMWGTSFTNTTVYITSDFHINNNFTIAGCIVKIDPGIRIVVDMGYLLIITSGITNSHLSACSNMWDGITIDGTSSSPGFLRIDNNTVIEDAEHAVFIPNSSRGFYRIQNSTFNKNWFHILIDHVSGNAYNGTSSTVDNSNFFCKDISTGIYTTLLSPHLLLRTNHALSFNSAGYAPTGIGFMLIGNGNTIENANVGVNNFNSHTNVTGSLIYDCGVGYFGTNDGTMQLNNSTIHDCLIGVESTAMALVDININQIYRISNTGIFIHLNRANVNIIKNSIYETLNGIVINDNNGDALIHDNQIYNGTVSTFPGSHGILVQQPIPYPSISLAISANYISQFEKGIFISTFDYAAVRGNYIDMDFIIPGLSYQIFAIMIENSEYFGVVVNTIKGTSTFNACDKNTCGVLIENCNEGGVICNEFGDPGIMTNQYTFNKNLYMRGVLDMNFVGGNNLVEHLYSLYIKDSPDGLGVQGDSYYVTDNEWLLSSGSPLCGSLTEDIISENSHSNNLTLFHVRSGLPFIHDLPIALTGTAALPNAISSSPMPDKLCTFLRVSGGNLESSIAYGSAFYINNSDAYKWYSQNWLYRSIPIYSMYSTPLFTDFYNTLDNGNYGALKNIFNQYSTSGTVISTSSFVPSNAVEDNIKTVIDIGAQINNQGINSISLMQKSIIDNISILCPLNDGPGVYMARAYRSLLNNQLYEYSSTCNTAGGANLRTQNNTNPKFQSTKLYYVNNELKINGETIEFYSIDIVDLTGKIVLSTKMNSNSSQNLDLPKGIYLYVLTSEQSAVNSLRGKLTIL